MRRYSTSKIRIALLMVLLAVGGFAVSRSFAQTTPAANGKDAHESASSAIVVTFNLVFGHLDDPIFIVIALLSVIGTTIIIQGFLKNRKSVFMPEETTNQIREMIGQRKFKELIDFTENDPSFVARALNPALKRAPSFSSMKEAMETAIGEQTAEQFRKIEYLNIIGNLGPLLGLLGTVMGMVQAFDMMQRAQGQASPAELAGGISTALTHTFLGLMLAVPCLAAFGILRTIVDRLTVQGALTAEELLLMIKPVEAKPAAVGALGAKPASPQPATRKVPAPQPAQA